MHLSLFGVFSLLALVQSEHVEESGNDHEIEGEKILPQLLKQIKRLTLALDRQDTKITDLEKINEKQERRMVCQDEIIHDIKSEMADMRSGNEFKRVITNSSGSEIRSLPVLHLQTVFACDLELITLSCTEGKTLLVESAYYGQYIHACSDACCLPHPLDCIESMEENAPGDWMILNSTCNGEQSCEFQNPGRDVPSCVSPYDSDYAMVYYSCTPEDESAPSAFTASTDTAREYNIDDVVIFDVIVTNGGNNYLATTSTYLCPRDGIYVFSVTVTNDLGFDMGGEIMREDQRHAIAWGEEVRYNQGSVTVVTECARGERVWVRSTGNGYRSYEASGHNWNVFSGRLLHAY